MAMSKPVKVQITSTLDVRVSSVFLKMSYSMNHIVWQVDGPDLTVVEPLNHVTSHVFNELLIEHLELNVERSGFMFAPNDVKKITHFQQNERRGTGFVFDTAGKENIEAQKANLLKKFNEINEEKIEETQNDQKS